MPWQVFVLAMTAIILCGMLFIIPVAGWTARRSLLPLIEAWAKERQLQDPGTGTEVAVVEERVSRLEARLEQVAEHTEFFKQLRDPPPGD